MENNNPLPTIGGDYEPIPIDFKGEMAEDLIAISNNMQDLLQEITDGISRQFELISNMFEDQKEQGARDRVKEQFDDNDEHQNSSSREEFSEKPKLTIEPISSSDFAQALAVSFLGFKFNIEDYISSVPMFKKLTDTVTDFSKYVTGIIGKLSAGMTKIKAVLKPVVKALDFAFDVIKMLARPILALGSAVGRFIPIVNGIIALVAFIEGAIRGYEEGGLARALELGLGGIFEQFITVPLNFLKDITAWLVNKMGFHETAGIIKNFDFDVLFTDIWNSFKGAVTWVSDKVLGLARDAWTNFKNSWASMPSVQSISNTMNSAGLFLYDWLVQKPIDGILALLKGEFSVSDVLFGLAKVNPLVAATQKVGEYFAQMDFAEPIIKFLDDVKAWMDENINFDKISEKLNSLVEGVFGPSEPESIMKGIGETPTSQAAPPIVAGPFATTSSQAAQNIQKQVLETVERNEFLTETKATQNVKRKADGLQRNREHTTKAMQLLHPNIVVAPSNTINVNKGPVTNSVSTYNDARSSGGAGSFSPSPQ